MKHGGGGVMALCSPSADAWSKEDCLTLLERIRSLLPDGDAMKYKTTESHFDWDKVGFGAFTGDMCRQKWQKVSSEVLIRTGCSGRGFWTDSDLWSLFQVRKYRTMTELIVDAIEFVKNPYKGKKLKVSGSSGSEAGVPAEPGPGLMSSLPSRLTQTSLRSLSLPTSASSWRNEPNTPKSTPR